MSVSLMFSESLISILIYWSALGYLVSLHACMTGGIDELEAPPHRYFRLALLCLGNFREV
jgi:hypothetical protein